MLFVFVVLLGVFVKVNVVYTDTGYCPKSDDCTWTLPYYVTQNLKCISKYQCPVGFLCCPDCHYQHNVCKVAVWFPNDERCPKDLKLCTSPFDYEQTKYYRCISHAQCYKTDLCCPDSCYSHKVCKPITKRRRNSKQSCPISVRRKSCPNTNRILTKYSCKGEEDCFPGYICCSDNCYDHMVCKLPIGAFSYKSVHKTSSYTTPPTFEDQHRCPNVKEKCLTPYSLRLAKKFICFKDEDCKIGQLCCKDACIKEFKICKDIFTLKPEEFTTPSTDKDTVSVKGWTTHTMNNFTSSAVTIRNVTKSPEEYLMASHSNHNDKKEVEGILQLNSELNSTKSPNYKGTFAENSPKFKYLNKENYSSGGNTSKQHVDAEFYFVEDEIENEFSGSGSESGSGSDLEVEEY